MCAKVPPNLREFWNNYLAKENCPRILVFQVNVAKKVLDLLKDAITYGILNDYI